MKKVFILLVLAVASAILHNVFFGIFKIEEPVFFTLTFVFGFGFAIGLLLQIGRGLFKLNKMNKQLLKDALGWGIALWLVGYALGIMLFAFVPLSLIGWIITPVGIAFALWILVKKIKSKSLPYYLILAVVWTLIAVTFDYVFLVKAFKPADGYYKLDIYLYYGLTFALPLLVGWRKKTGK